MSTFRTVQDVAHRHQANSYLSTRSQPPMPEQAGFDLSTDQPGFALDYAMVESARMALESGQTHYVDVPGIAALREALATYLAEFDVVGYPASALLVSAGIQESRFLTVQMIGASAEGIVIPEVVHPGVLKAIGVRPLAVQRMPVNRERGYLPTPGAIRVALQEGAKLIYLESPARLTGAIFTPEEVQQIAQIVREHDGWVIWDQGLAPWVTSGQYVSLGAVPEMAGRVALIGEAWPGTGLDSLMVGYVAAGEEWLEAIRSQKQIMAICTSTPSQYAALKAPVAYKVFHHNQHELLWAIRERAIEHAQQVGSQTLAGATSTILALAPADCATAIRRLHAAGFTVGDGADYGAPETMRLAITLDNGVAKALCYLG